MDHVVPEKHGGLTAAGNLALACTLCNKLKGSDLASIDPETNEIVPLFNLRSDSWHTHFRVDSSGRIEGLTPVARATIQLLQLNLPERVEERSSLQNAGLLT